MAERESLMAVAFDSTSTIAFLFSFLSVWNPIKGMITHRVSLVPNRLV